MCCATRVAAGSTVHNFSPAWIGYDGASMCPAMISMILGLSVGMLGPFHRAGRGVLIAARSRPTDCLPT